MYCEKLKYIIDDNESIKNTINLEVLKKLDFFLKNKITLVQRNYINPVKFALEMEISEQISLMTFIIGSKHELFKLRPFYSCHCGEMNELFSTRFSKKCFCGEQFNPCKHKDRIFLFFRLLENLLECEELSPKKEYQIDYLESLNAGKSYVSLIQLENIIGEERAEYLVVNQRDRVYENYILERNVDFEAT